jgi:hypothetical protein
LTTIAILTVTFIGDDQKIHVGYDLPFCVFNTTSDDMIIGLPSIIGTFSILHKEMIDHAVSQLPSVAPSVRELQQASSGEVAGLETGQIIQPWSIAPDTQAPEDEDTPAPCPSQVHYILWRRPMMRLLFADYLAMLTEHVSADFAEATDIMNLLKGKAMKVFVPVSWDGINGLEPLKLTWKPGKPTHRSREPDQSIRS